MPSNAILRTIMGLTGAGLCVLGVVGVLTGLIDMAGLGSCFDEICVADPATVERRTNVMLTSIVAFLLGGAVCVYLARQS